MLSILFITKYFLATRGGSLVRTIGRVSFLGIFLGVFSLILVLSIMAGFNTTLKKRLLNIEPHIVVHDAHVDTVRAILGDEFKADVYAFEIQDAVVRSEDGVSGGAVFMGLAPERLKQVVQYENPDIPISHFIPGADEVIVGRDVASTLNLFADSEMTVIPPETLIMPAGTQMQFSHVRVRNLFETGINDIDGKMIYYVIGQSLRNFAHSPARQTGCEVMLAEPWVADQVQGLLHKAGLRSETWAERNSAILKSLRIERTMVGVFVGLSALIAGFSIVGVVSLLLTQKRQDLGVLMSLGVSRRRLTRLYTSIGFGMAALAILLGALCATVVSFILDRYPIEVLPPIYQDRTIPAELNGAFVGTVVVAGLILAFVAAAWSVRMHLSGRTPVQLLRRSSQ